MPFKKGQSGNPGGRPKAEVEIRRAIQLRGQMLIDRLLAIVGTSKDEGNVLRAIHELLDRGYGKPPESIKIAGGVTVEHRKRVILEGD
jgi:hypothetical protein